MNMGRIKTLLGIFTCLALTVGVGFSSWMLPMEENISIKHDNAAPVAYIKTYDTDNETVKTTSYFTSLGGALDFAYNSSGKDEIYVIPKTSKVSDNDAIVLDSKFAKSGTYTIKSNDSLILPYADETITTIISQHPSLAYESGTRLNYVKVNSGLTIVNNGTISIGGVQNSGNGGNHYNGNTTDKYSEIHLSGTSKIINNSGSFLNCYGYISGDYTQPSNDESPAVNLTFKSGSTCNLLFTIVEHRGGQRFLGMSNSDSNIKSMLVKAVAGGADAKLTCFVFNRYFVDNLLDVYFEFDENSVLKGNGCLFADGNHHSAVITLLGNDDGALIKFGTNSKIEGWYSKTDKKTNLITYGSIVLNHLALNLELEKSSMTAKINISSKDVLLPISHYFSITCKTNSGSDNIVDTSSQGLKLLPGSSLLVEEGVALKVKNIAIYPNSFFYPDGINSIEVTKDTGANSRGVASIPYPIKEDAVLEIDGTLTASSLGGIYSKGQNANISITTKSVSSSELTDTKDAQVKIAFVITMNYKSAIYTTKMLQANEIVK